MCERKASFNPFLVAAVLVLMPGLTSCTKKQPASSVEQPPVVASAEEPSWPIFQGQTYHVAPNGGTGSSQPGNPPMKTLQEALDLLKPGDGCIIHGGIYRETLTPKVNGSLGALIQFVAMPGETVTFSGLDPVGPFERVDARTWRTKVDWDLGSGNQVFRDGKPLIEARWPNKTGDEPFKHEGARAEREGSEWDRLRSNNFPAEWRPEDLNGATVWCMALYRWSSLTMPVTGYDPQTRTLMVKGHDNAWGKQFHNPGLKAKWGPDELAEFYISNARILLDAPGEWFYDSKEKNLYLSVAENDDPNQAVIEMKRRQTAVDLAGRSYIRIDGLHLVGSSMTLKDAQFCEVNAINARYICHTRGGHTGQHAPDTEGIFISGSNNTLRNSEIAFSTGNGVNLYGNDNALINCFIHDTDTIASYAACVDVKGTGHLISHNTLRDSGRDCIRSLGGNVIQFNDISGAGRICHDTGAFYSNGDGGNGQICYNWVHDVDTSLGNGIYLDNYNHSWLVHHNVMWNISGNAIQFNHPSRYNFISNNTIFGSSIESKFNISPWKGQKIAFGNLFANNLVAKKIDLAPNSGAIEMSNIVHQIPIPADGFDPNRDIIAEGLDQGVILSLSGEGFHGEAPDSGAYEAGQPVWRAGHDFSNPPTPQKTLISSYYRNYLTNGTFNSSSGSLIPGWVITAGVCEVKSFPGFVESPETRNSIYSGSLGLKGEAQARAEQAVMDLRPGADFSVSAYIRSEGADDVVLSVSGPDGEIGSTRFSASEVSIWRHVQVDFRVPTSGTVTVAFTKEGRGDAYVDEVGMVPVLK
jgi:hypothetical protein